MPDFPENSPDSEGEPPLQRCRRWSWRYVPALLLLFVWPLLKIEKPAAEISWQQFERNILGQKPIEKIIIINNERAEIYLRNGGDTAARNLVHPWAVLETTSGPNYFITTGSSETFERKLDEAK